MPIDIDKLEDSNHLLEILIQMENIFDDLDVYVSRNWFDGEVVEGPTVRRHEVSWALLYPEDKMPDPRATLRLLKHGITVEYAHVRRAGDRYPTIDDEGRAVDAPTQTEGDGEGPTFWLIRCTFPRRLLPEMSPDVDAYEDDVDLDDVQSAEDAGLTDESAYDKDTQDEVTPGGDAAPGQDPDLPPGGAPPAPPAGAPR